MQSEDISEGFVVVNVGACVSNFKTKCPLMYSKKCVYIWAKENENAGHY